MDVRSGPNFRGIDHRPNARGHATANERGFIQGHILADLHHGVLMHQELFRIGGEIGELMHYFPALGEAWRFIGTPQGVHPVAEIRTACRTVVAMATEDGQTGDDMVPRLHVAYFGAYCFDNTSGFVAEHDASLVLEALGEIERKRLALETLLDEDLFRTCL